MTTSRHTVRLPDGEAVVISSEPEDWWSTQNASGFVNPHLLATDLDQPRRHMNAAKLAELDESIATKGVRQPLIVTPRGKAPWIRVAPEQESLPFRIVAGHRRTISALHANVAAVPVQVRIYPGEREYRLDASLTNKGNEPLTDIEEGWEIVNLREHGCTIAELKTAFGMAMPQIYIRINLTRLHPNIQKHLDPELSSAKRLGTVLGGTLGAIKVPTVSELEELYDTFYEAVKHLDVYHPSTLAGLDDNNLRFAMQKLLFAVIGVRRLQGDRALEFIREHSLKLQAAMISVGGPKTEKYQPANRLDVFLNLLKTLDGSVVLDWKPEEWRRITEYMSYEQLGDLIASATKARDLFDGIIKTLKNRQSTQRPTHPAVLALHAKGKSS